ncbi:sensor histidine kinase [Oryzibacter oryziterrae]|uniref:sensor histidine kinase n=1 Tax=Oryzibacter oryziterrae TaxID=2766474 RepID=UPI001F275C1E|nr:HAMP domain-containing sensor histidine kinase [Oryzibacter oryziterrae]
MPSRRRKPASLIALVSGRILTFAVLAMAIQFVVVFSEYWFNETELGRIMIEREAEAIAASVQLAPSGAVEIDLKGQALARYGDGDNDDGDAIRPASGDTADAAPGGDSDLVAGTYVRIRTADGRVLYTNCSEECREHFLPVELDPPDFWQSLIAPGKPLSVSGGRTFLIGGQKILIEVAILHDPSNFIREILLHEMFDHMLVPMSLMLALVIGATTISIRKALRPVAAAAEAADAINPSSPTAITAAPGMPREIAFFVEAINRLLQRSSELFKAQRVFAAAIAHEIRTPVAIVKLELERIEDPRARRAEADLDRLMHILEQLTALAKLDMIDAGAFETVELNALTEEAVAEMVPFVLDRSKSIAFQQGPTVNVKLVPSLIQNVVRNLIENAVRHTPDGTEITVSVGPGAVLVVADNGPGMADGADLEIDSGRIKKAGGLGMGLRIVERITEIHDAQLTVTSETGQGTTVSLRFP